MVGNPEICRYLSDETSVHEVLHSETWPFLVKVSIQCLSSKISSSKKRLPKLIFAKTRRIIVQRAQEDGCSVSGYLRASPTGRIPGFKFQVGSTTLSCASVHGKGGNMPEHIKYRSIEPQRRGFLFHLDTSFTS